IQKEVPLAPLTTFKTGGTARFFAEVRTEGQLKESLTFAREKNLPFFILGGGSNLLVSDDGFPGFVIQIKISGKIFFSLADGNTRVTVGAGEHWDTLVADVVSRNLSGLELLSGIPGSVGAAPVQNIGAYGAEIKNTIESVEVFDTKEMKKKTLSALECEFSYRESIFKTSRGARHIILSVSFLLSGKPPRPVAYRDLVEFFAKRGTPPAGLLDIRETVLAIRDGKFPDLALFGTAGSFFKNLVIQKEKYNQLKETYPLLPGFSSGDNIKIPLAWVIDNILHLKGVRRGNVGVYEKQAIVLINFGGAKAGEVYAFAQDIKARVKEVIGCEPEFEVRQLGTF
ncbi:MAG: UDP-N-acetylmuramate dehydrogenase, partial [Patescibacteria group bacterium]